MVKILKYKYLRLKLCPYCHTSTKIYFTDDVCPFCGKDLTNRCMNAACNEPLDAAARYCRSCGSKSFYNSLHLFRDWREEYDENS